MTLLSLTIGALVGYIACALLTKNRMADALAERARELRARVDATQAVQVELAHEREKHAMTARVLEERLDELHAIHTTRSNAGRKAAETRRARATVLYDVPPEPVATDAIVRDAGAA